MLRKEDLKLADAIKYGKSAEVTQKDLEQLNGDVKDIHRLTKYAKDERKLAIEGNVKDGRRNGNQGGRRRCDEKDLINNCKFCSYSHSRGYCPAYNKTCNICGKRGHFRNRCMKKEKMVKQVER